MNLEAVVASELLEGLIEGDVDDGSLLAGQIAGMIKDIKSVEEIIKEMVS